VDGYLEALVDAVAARGELDRTVVVFLSDNGYAFGEHRWEGKLVPYDPSIRIPFAVRSPWTGGGTVSGLVSNLDVAPRSTASAWPTSSGAAPVRRRPGPRS
jgi:N-acetylglucosamine-6-sulfatase